jgi:hypothetical protein
MGIQKLRDEKKYLEEKHRNLDALIWKKSKSNDELKTMKLQKLSLKRDIEVLDNRIKESINALESSIKSLTNQPINVNV